MRRPYDESASFAAGVQSFFCIQTTSKGVPRLMQTLRKRPTSTKPCLRWKDRLTSLSEADRGQDRADAQCPAAGLEVGQHLRADALAGGVRGDEVGDLGDVGGGGPGTVRAEQGETQEAAVGGLGGYGREAVGGFEEAVEERVRQRVLREGGETVSDVVVEQIDDGPAIGGHDRGKLDVHRFEAP